MIKGIHKQVVVVRDFNCDVFEQAIFVLKPETNGSTRKSSEKVMIEARKVVDNYLQR